jgi:methylenetetrahydrofolate reductase (NADH)
MRLLRHWSVRHAFGLLRLYDECMLVVLSLRRVLQSLGPHRFERLVLPVERAAKHILFDCKMCGQCVLSSTGMACPTNCQKQMRNGPCGGVRPTNL